MKIDWKKKLTSRKFWAALVGFVAPILLAFGVSDSTVTQVVAIVIAGGTCIAYIFGEGIVDAKHVGTTTDSSSSNGISDKTDEHAEEDE